MSMKTYQEAIEYVLSSELNDRTDLIVFRPGAKRALEEPERDVALPHMGKAVFSMALGAALTGMRPVIDLRQETDCADLLLDALCELPAVVPPMTMIAGAEDAELLTELPGLLAMTPRTPRQAAGFARAALRCDQTTLLIADQALYEEADEVPEDSDFVMMPLTDEPEEDTCEETGAEAAVPAEEQAGEAETTEAEMIEEEDEASPEAFSAGGTHPEELPEEEAAAVPAADDDFDEETSAETGEPESVSSEEADREISGETDCGEAAAEEKGSEEMTSEEQASEEDASEGAACGEESSAEEESADEDAEEAVSAGPQDLPCLSEPAQEAGSAAGMRCAARMTPCSLSNLIALACELEMSAQDLIARCMAHAAQDEAGFEWVFEAEAAAGECAFLPPEEKTASVWLGSDRLTVCYDPRACGREAAAGLMRAIRRVLEKPTLLIYDKERERR